MFNRFKYLGLLTGSLLVVAGVSVGCKPKSSPPAGQPRGAGYFQTSFQSECQFIVQAIVSDLAEEMWYAAKHEIPAKQAVTVIATEKAGSPVDAPVYALQIHLGAKQVKCDLAVNGPIWSPSVYQGVAKQLAEAVGLKPGGSEQRADVSLLDKLSDGKPETMERENQRLSADLEKDFSNPEWHEQAAVLLGAFLLRDHSGYFFEIRSPLSRLTAHLALADFLRDSKPAGLNGQMAEAMMLTLVGDEAKAVEELSAIGTNDAVVLPMVRALRARNTGDYRPLDHQDGLSRVECVAWFQARASYVAASLTWPLLNDDQKQTVDFVRVANDIGYSVQMGHQLLAESISLELQEIQNIYTLAHAEKLTQKTLVTALNELPEESCFSRVEGKEHVRVIGWGQWADFLQRHLCHAVQQNFYFMNRQWGVPDEAREFAAKCEQMFDGLRLYPFVRRFNCTDEASYHKAVDDAFKVTVATPQLVPAECWNYLCYSVNFAKRYEPNPNPHINEWHSHNPPPGTVYDLHPRLNHPSLVGRAAAVARFEQLHQMAPYDCRISEFLVEHQYKETPTYEQATNLYQAVLPYSIAAMRVVANTLYSQPELYRQWMLQAAALNPACYYNLGDYEIGRTNEDLAAEYIDRACEADPDSVRVANHAYWRVKHYLNKGQLEKARQIADEGGEVYSEVGLEAKATFFEMTTNYADAFEWFAKLEERYDDVGPLLAFCERYKSRTGDTRFDAEVEKRVKKVFPRGMEPVALADFQGPPADGVQIRQQNDRLRAAGLRAGDVIVALNGTRTHTLNQYLFVRNLLTGPELDLIVWKASGYRAIKASPPQRKFNADFGDYRPR